MKILSDFNGDAKFPSFFRFVGGKFQRNSGMVNDKDDE